MQFLRRLLYIPIILVLVGALLSIFDIVDFGVRLPISVELIAAIAGGLLAILSVAELRVTTTGYEHPEPEDPPRSTKVIYPKVIEDAVESVNEAEEYVIKSNGRVQVDIEIEEDPEEEG